MGGGIPIVWKDAIDIVIAVFTLGIAAAAFWYSYRQGSWQERHDQLSVTPLVLMHFAHFIDGNGLVRIDITLKNVGLGPAKFRSMTLTDLEERTTFRLLGASRMQDREIENQGYEMVEAGALGAGDTEVMAVWIFSTSQEHSLTDFIRSLYNITFRLEYESIYGIEQPPLVQTGEMLRNRFETEAAAGLNT